MKRFFNIFFILFALLFPFQQYQAFANGTSVKISNLSGIGFHKRSELSPEMQIRKLFENYQKYTNAKDVDKFLNLYSNDFKNNDGYDKNRLKELATEAWKEFPSVRYSLTVLSVDVDIDNARVFVNERLSGITNATTENIDGTGYINSESMSVYYLKRFSNEWLITSDFIISEKTSMKFGTAKYIPMLIDAPSIISPNEEYTAVVKLDIPEQYVGLVSIANEPMSRNITKTNEVFRGIKSHGIRERILTSNNEDRNENAIASIGIIKPNIKEDTIDINITGIAYLSTRVNVVNHKLQEADIKKVSKTESNAK